MTLRASLAAVVIGTLALLGSFALPIQVETQHAEVMDCDAHHGCAPVSASCISLCLDAVKDEGVAVMAIILAVAAFLGIVSVASGRFVALFARTIRPLVPIAVLASDIRITRKRLD